MELGDVKELGALAPWLSHNSHSDRESRQRIVFCQRGSEQMGQRQHHLTDMEKLQEMPQAPQQGCDPPADPQPRYIPIQKVYPSLWSCSTNSREQPRGAHSQFLPPLRSRKAASPSTAEKQHQSWQGTAP